jgi:hypothetical protein
MPRKYPPLRSGDGYTSGDKDNFDHSVSITFNYGDIPIKIDEANKLAQTYLGKVTKDFQSALKDVSKDNLLLSSVKGGTIGAKLLFPGEYKKKMESDISEVGKIFASEMKEEIRNVISRAPGARGAGRIDTYRMFDFVQGKRTSWDREKGILTVSAGWLTNWYKYFGFQENGTYQIKPMNAISHTAMVSFAEAYRFVRMYTARFSPKKGFRGFR